MSRYNERVSTLPLFIDSDNALGSRRGDVDDGFALAALLKAGAPILGLASVFGNTRESFAYRNNQRLAQALGYRGPVLRGAEGPGQHSSALDFLKQQKAPYRYVALGPLTQVAQLLKSHTSPLLPSDVVLVGSNSRARGMLRPMWPFEFNLVMDRNATWTVFKSTLPLTVVPLDVARRLRAGAQELTSIPGMIGQELRAGSERWLKRSRRLKFQTSFPVGDLVAAMVVLAPELFEIRESMITPHRRGWIEFEQGERPIRWVADFKPRAVWDRFVEILTE